MVLFGLVSMYENDQTTPPGNTEFPFPAAGEAINDNPMGTAEDADPVTVIAHGPIDVKT